MATMILTGCASGIGRHLTTTLARRGHRIMATDVDAAKLDEAAQDEGWSDAAVKRRALDVRSEEAWETALDALEAAFGPADVAMNVAGVLMPAYAHAFEAKHMHLQLDVNVKGVMLGTRAASKRMIARRSGHIVNIGSLASLAPTPGLSIYAASKFAVRGFSLAAATELRPHGVAVTLVMPDAVKTPMLDLQVDYEEAALTFSGAAPLMVEDVANAIVDEVLPRRPIELALPLGRSLLARVANTAPWIASVLAPSLLAKGRAAQRRIKGR